MLYFQKYKYIIILFFFGFSSGLPLSLVYGTLSIWLNEAGIDKASITFFSWASIGYSFKFIWAPLIDHVSLPFLYKLLGRRRSWLILSQLLVAFSIMTMAMIDPAKDGNIVILAFASICLGFSSATQDIVIDAYRIECTSSKYQGQLAAGYTAGYRVALIIAGAVALILSGFLGSSKADYLYSAWRYTYLLMSILMSIGVLTTLLIKEPVTKQNTLDAKASQQLVCFFSIIIIPFCLLIYLSSVLSQHIFGQNALDNILINLTRYALVIISCYYIFRTLLKKNVISTASAKKAYLTPIYDFLNRYSTKAVILVLLLIGLYRISDIVFGTVTNIFYQDIGFSKLEIGTISKTFGMGMTILGSFLGAYLTTRLNLFIVLMVGAILSSFTNLLYIVLSYLGDNSTALIFVISFDNLAVGIASIAFISFLSKLTSIKFTATQYAIFTSLMMLLPKIIGGFSGSITNAWGYNGFFIFTAIIGLPILFLIFFVFKEIPVDVKSDLDD